MNAEVIAVGSELVNGQKLDTNSQWLSRRLEELGVHVRYHTVLADDLKDNIEAFRVAGQRADLVIVSGGLGPTQDDLTREALAALAGVPLVEDEASLQALEAFFARRQRPMAERNRLQAHLPQGAEALPNRAGTAPGIWMGVGRATFACLPGVPGELKIMFDEQVVPRLRRDGRLNRVIVHRVVNLFGRGESDIEAEALDLTARGHRPEIGITASDATISFRISSEGVNEQAAQTEIEAALALIRQRFGDLVVGEGNIDVPEALVAQLERTGATIATAESCTGGLIAQRITAIAGVSPYFLGGVVSYSNEAKADLLGVSPSLIAAQGAVSAEVAEAMAEGVRLRFSSTIGLSVTGIAGPSGGTPQKPVGLVYLGLSGPGGVGHQRLELGPEQSRDVIRSRAAKHAMNWARLALLRLPDSTAPAG